MERIGDGNGYLTMVQKSIKAPRPMYKTIVILAQSSSTQENNQLFFIQPNPAQLSAVPKKKFMISLYTYLSQNTLHVCVNKTPSRKKKRIPESSSLDEVPPGNGYISHQTGKGTSSSKCHFFGGYVSVPRRVSFFDHLSPGN